jgi:hypothetical protein
MSRAADHRAKQTSQPEVDLGASITFSGGSSDTRSTGYFEPTPILCVVQQIMSRMPLEKQSIEFRKPLTSRKMMCIGDHDKFKIDLLRALWHIEDTHQPVLLEVAQYPTERCDH